MQKINDHHTLSFSTLAACAAFIQLVQKCDGVFRHYKGGAYKVNVTQPLTMHTETGDVFVNYAYAQFADYQREPGETTLGYDVGFSRPLEMFTSYVEHEGRRTMRFEPVLGDSASTIGAEPKSASIVDALSSAIKSVDLKGISDAAVRELGSLASRVVTFVPGSKAEEQVAEVTRNYEARLNETVPAEKYLDAVRESEMWQQTAADMSRNAEFTRGLLTSIARAHCGDDVYIQDDGGRVDTPLLIKIPEILTTRFNQHAATLNQLRELQDRGAAQPADLEPIGTVDRAPDAPTKYATRADLENAAEAVTPQCPLPEEVYPPDAEAARD